MNILLINYNRPSHTARIVSVARNLIRLSKVKVKVYAFCDGPKDKVVDYLDQARVSEVRRLLGSLPLTDALFLDHNKGCRDGVIEAIDFFFDKVDCGIIMEDDLNPHPDFFFWANHMLQQYRSNDRVFSISGNHLLPHPPARCITFSRFPIIWGWATWASRWEHMIRPMPRIHFGTVAADIGVDVSKVLSVDGITGLQNKYLTGKILESWDGSSDTWDYLWTFSHFNYEGVSIIPRTNMVAHMGRHGTHVFDNRKWEFTPQGWPGDDLLDKKFDSTLFSHIHKKKWRLWARAGINLLRGKY